MGAYIIGHEAVAKLERARDLLAEAVARFRVDRQWARAIEAQEVFDLLERHFFTPEEGAEICGSCNGSGEGPADRTRCDRCDGWGETWVEEEDRA